MFVELNKDNTRRRARADGEKPGRPQLSKELQASEKAGSTRGGGLSQGRAHQSVVHCRMVSVENIHASNIIRTEWVIFKK